jgi:hypothetical protein
VIVGGAHTDGIQAAGEPITDLPPVIGSMFADLASLLSERAGER